MGELSWAALRQHLVDHYEDICKILARRLKPEDLARETRHETWMRFDRQNAVGLIANPTGCILHTAANIVVDRARKERRLALTSEVTDLLRGRQPRSPVEYPRAVTRSARKISKSTARSKASN